jgi:hypothetical protein
VAATEEVAMAVLMAEAVMAAVAMAVAGPLGKPEFFGPKSCFSCRH